jgi:hypothetical protein
MAVSAVHETTLRVQNGAAPPVAQKDEMTPDTTTLLPLLQRRAAATRFSGIFQAILSLPA